MLLSGCLLFAGRHWEETRIEVIEPINSAIHRHLPRDLQNKHLEAVLSAYATEVGDGLPWDAPREVADDFGERRFRWTGPAAAETIRQRYESLVALFDRIEKTEVRIHRVYWYEPDTRGYPAEVRLIVRGLDSSGRRLTLDQRARIRIGRRGGRWLITAEEITARELLVQDEPVFSLVSEAAGNRDTHDTHGAPVFRLVGSTTLSSGSAVADVNCDGLEDLALLSARRLALYRNLGDGTFDEISAGAGFSAAFDIAATGLVFFDADNDGDPDLWIYGVRGERFFRNEGCTTFVDATAGAGLKPSRWSSMPIVADYDRDGFAHVYVIRMGDRESDPPQPNWDARNGLPSTLYRNNGDGTFTDVAYVNRADRVEDGRGLSIFDYDRDGRLDVLLRSYKQPAQLLRNTGPAGHWLRLKLIGTHSNRDAIGARVTLFAGSRRQTSELRAGSGVSLEFVPPPALRPRNRNAGGPHSHSLARRCRDGPRRCGGESEAGNQRELIPGLTGRLAHGSNRGNDPMPHRSVLPRPSLSSCAIFLRTMSASRSRSA